MGLNNGTGQEGQNGDTVRTMSDLPDRGLERIEIIKKNFLNNEISQILNFNTGKNNELIDRIDDSQKEEELYSRYIDLGDYQEALELCNLMIQGEVKKQFLRGSQRGFNFRNGAYEVNFDAVSTPTALKWKQRIEEIEDIAYSKLKESGKTKEALELCNLMIQREVEREISERVQGGYILKPGTDEVNFDTVSTSTALKWKQRIGEIQDLKYLRFVEEGKTKEALELCNLMIQGEVKKSFRQLDIKKYIYDIMPTSDSILTPTALKWKQRITELTK